MHDQREETLRSMVDIGFESLSNEMVFVGDFCIWVSDLQRASLSIALVCCV